MRGLSRSPRIHSNRRRSRTGRGALPGSISLPLLQNVIERSIIVCETETFTVDESWLSQRPLYTRSGSNLSLSFGERLQLRKKKSSKRFCENPKDGYSDHPVPRPGWGLRGPPWNRRFGHSTSIRIALGLRRELEDSQPKSRQAAPLPLKHSLNSAVSVSPALAGDI